MHIDRTALHDVKADGFIALAKEIAVAREIAKHRESGDGGDIFAGETRKQLAAAQGASDSDDFQIRCRRHIQHAIRLVTGMQADRAAAGEDSTRALDSNQFAAIVAKLDADQVWERALGCRFV